MDTTIEAHGLVKRFGDTTALGGVDLAARTGTVLAVLGPNGAGKTTAVRILATLLQPDEGRARVAGDDVVAQAQQVRRLIALTGQYAAVDESLTGAENLLLIGRLLGLPRGAARRRGPSCWTSSAWPTPAAGRPRPTRAACAAAWTWPPAWSAGPGCCTWTSRPPAWTPGPATTCGG